jgi:amicyanin
MKNNKPIIIAAIVAIIIVVGGIALASTMKQSDDKTTHSSEDMNMPSSETTTKSETPQAANAVVIRDYKYSPTPITVKKGTTVTWTNQDAARHNVVVDEGEPAGGPTDGPLIGKGETYSFTFNTVGTFNYHCSPHPYMKGSVVVTE